MKLTPITPDTIPFWRARFLEAFEWASTSSYASIYDVDSFLTDPTSVWRIGTAVSPLSGTEAPTGIVGLQHINMIDGVAEPVIAVAPDWRRDGKGLEMSNLLISFAFDNLNMRKLQAAILPDALSIHLLRKCGFEEEGVRKAARYYNGKYVDLLLFGLRR